MKDAILRIIQNMFHTQTGIIKGKSSPLLELVDRSRLFSSDHLIRLGTPYGGWIIPRSPALTENSVCYLAGAGEDISFDCALVKSFRCKVRIIDPTPRAAQHFRELERTVIARRRFSINNSDTDFYDIHSVDLARLSFSPFGLADKDAEIRFFMPKDPAHVSCSIVNLQKTDKYFTAQCYKLSTLMSQHGDTEVDLLKLDIEGAEYMVIRDLLATNFLPPILLIEFDEAHTPIDDYSPDRIGAYIKLLLGAGMRCIAVEGCNATFVRSG
jgi:FkbM family methyltransferase